MSAATTPDALAAGSRRCALCNALLGGPYCAQCGQPDPRAVRSLRDVMLGQTGKLAHTLRMLLGRPGELAREIDEGRDCLSLRPLTLLLNLIALFFVVGSGPGGFHAGGLIRGDASGRLEAIAAERAAKRGHARALYDERLENRFQSTYSLLIPLFALVYGAALALVERRKRKTWVVHLSTAVHYLCATFLVSAALFGIARVAGVDALAWNLLPVVSLVYSAICIVLMLRRIYADSWPMAAAKTAFVLAVGGASDTALAYVALAVALVTA